MSFEVCTKRESRVGAELLACWICFKALDLQWTSVKAFGLTMNGGASCLRESH